MIKEIPSHPSFALKDFFDSDFEYMHLVYHGPQPTSMEEAFAISIEKQECMIWANKAFPKALGILCGEIDTCGLCMYYMLREDEDGFDRMDCTFCPVFSVTGLGGCEGTPWMRRDWQGELDFLLKLRDAEREK